MRSCTSSWLHLGPWMEGSGMWMCMWAEIIFNGEVGEDMVVCPSPVHWAPTQLALCGQPMKAGCSTQCRGSARDCKPWSRGKFGTGPANTADSAGGDQQQGAGASPDARDSQAAALERSQGWAGGVAGCSPLQHLPVTSQDRWLADRASSSSLGPIQGVHRTFSTERSCEVCPRAQHFCKLL